MSNTMTDTVPLPPPVRSGCYPYNAEDMRTYAAAVSAADNAALRQIIRDVLAALGTTAGCSTDASLDFLRGVPEEVRLTVADLRGEIANEQEAGDALSKRVEELEADAGRYRWLLESRGYQLHGKPSIEAAWDDDIDDYRGAWFFGLKSDEAISAAIDAALLSQPKEPK